MLQSDNVRFIDKHHETSMFLSCASGIYLTHLTLGIRSIGIFIPFYNNCCEDLFPCQVNDTRCLTKSDVFIPVWLSIIIIS